MLVLVFFFSKKKVHCNTCMTATKVHGTYKCIAMCWNLLMVQNSGKKHMRPHYCHHWREYLLGDKRKRDTRSDVVQTRENDPNMMKRIGTKIECSYCKGVGHNTRTCKRKVRNVHFFMDSRLLTLEIIILAARGWIKTTRRHGGSGEIIDGR